MDAMVITITHVYNTMSTMLNYFKFPHCSAIHIWTKQNWQFSLNVLISTSMELFKEMWWNDNSKSSRKLEKISICFKTPCKSNGFFSHQSPCNFEDNMINSVIKFTSPFCTLIPIDYFDTANLCSKTQNSLKDPMFFVEKLQRIENISQKLVLCSIIKGTFFAKIFWRPTRIPHRLSYFLVVMYKIKSMQRKMNFQWLVFEVELTQCTAINKYNECNSANL